MYVTLLGVCYVNLKLLRKYRRYVINRDKKFVAPTALVKRAIYVYWVMKIALLKMKNNFITYKHI